MKSLSALLVFGIITGCSTPYDLRQTKPKITYITTRPAEEVMKCIRSKWRGHMNPVLEEKTSNGWLVRYNDVLPAATVVVATIEGDAPNVEVNYYHRTNRIKLHRVEEEVKSCKENKTL
jgi:hypothetical protein